MNSTPADWLLAWKHKQIGWKNKQIFIQLGMNEADTNKSSSIEKTQSISTRNYGLMPKANGGQLKVELNIEGVRQASQE